MLLRKLISTMRPRLENDMGEKTKKQGMKDNVFFRDATHLKENTSKAGDALCVCVCLRDLRSASQPYNLIKHLASIRG